MDLSLCHPIGCYYELKFKSYFQNGLISTLTQNLSMNYQFTFPYILILALLLEKFKYYFPNGPPPSLIVFAKPLHALAASKMAPLLSHCHSMLLG